MRRGENIKGQGFHTNPERINKDGRPKKLPGLDHLLAECLGENGEEAKAILQALIKKAKRGDVRAAEVILDRCYGKARQVIDQTTKEYSVSPQAEIDYTQLSEQTLKEILRATKINNDE